jgi:transcriptional regulator with XRE-family HTH domain
MDGERQRRQRLGMTVEPHTHSGAAQTGAFGALLRNFRTARRMSQLDLALGCDVSARHLSFLESGRAQPSREMVLQLSEGLLLPRDARNTLLKAAGFAPVFPVSPLESEALRPFRAVLADLTERHAPYPAMLCDRHWTIRDANASARALLSAFNGPAGEMNVVRMLTQSANAPDIIANYAEVLAEFSGRIGLEALEAAGDDVLQDLAQIIAQTCARHPHSATPRRPLAPIVINHALGQLQFLSAVAHFGTSEDVTVRDLRLELLFPADDATRAALANL